MSLTEVDYYRNQDKVVDKLRQQDPHGNNVNNSIDSSSNNDGPNSPTNNKSPSTRRKNKKHHHDFTSHHEQQAMAPIDGNYNQMVKLFQAKEHEVTNLPAPDEIRVPLELYTVVQERMIEFRSQLDDVKKENFVLTRQHSHDLDKMNHLTTERNQLAQALATARLRLDQVQQINADLLKERDHHQETAEGLDSQVAFAHQEAEDRGTRLAAVLKDNDDLIGRKQWLEQQVSGLEYDREAHEKAANTAQGRLKVALLTTTKLASEKRNLMVALEIMKDELLKQRELIIRLENGENNITSSRTETDDGSSANNIVREGLGSKSPVSGLFNQNANLQEWLQEFLKENDYAKRSEMLLMQNQAAVAMTTNNNINNKRISIAKQQQQDEDEDDEEPQANDAEARHATELAMLMAIEKSKKQKKYYETKLQSLERTVMEEHEQRSIEAQRSALMTLAKDFASATNSTRGGNNNNNSDDSDDDEDEDGDTSLGRAMRALTQFSSGVPAHLAKEMAEAVKKENEMKARRLAIENGEIDNENNEISIDDDTPAQDGNNNNNEDETGMPVYNSSEERVASTLLAQALSSSSATKSYNLSSPKSQLELSQHLSQMDPHEASAFIASLLSPSMNNGNNSNNNNMVTFNSVFDSSSPTMILRTKPHDPMSKSGWDASSVRNNQQHNRNGAAAADGVVGRKDSSSGTTNNNISSALFNRIGIDHTMAKSALFRKFFRDTEKEDELATIQAATESIMTGVKTAETVIEYVDECTAQSLSLQDLRDRWEAIKHLVRARVSETASEAKVFSKECYRHLTMKLSAQIYQLQAQIQQGGGKVLNTTLSGTMGSLNDTTATNNTNLNSSTTKPIFFASTNGRSQNQNINNHPMHSHTKYYKANVSSVVAATFNKHKNDKKNDSTTANNATSGSKDSNNNNSSSLTEQQDHQNPTSSPTTTKLKVPQRHVAISCNIQPRPETAHWCHNTLIQPKDLNEVDGALFGLLPKLFFELHNVIHEVIRESRHRAKITIPIADPASFIGDGERRTIADVHCALKFDMFALMGLRDVLKLQGKHAKGTVTSHELRERLVWYKECVESQRLAQLDERFRIDPKLLHRLNIVDRQALTKYRSETSKRFKMPGTLQISEKEVEIDGQQEDHNNHHLMSHQPQSFYDHHQNNNQDENRISAMVNAETPAFVRDVFNSAQNITSSHDVFTQDSGNNNTSSEQYHQYQRKTSQQHLFDPNQQLHHHHHQYHHPKHLSARKQSSTSSYNLTPTTSFLHQQQQQQNHSPNPPSTRRQNSVYGNINNGNSNNTTTTTPSPHQRKQSSNNSNNNNHHHIPANVVVDPRVSQNKVFSSSSSPRQHQQHDDNNNNHNDEQDDDNDDYSLPPVQHKSLTTSLVASPHQRSELFRRQNPQNHLRNMMMMNPSSARSPVSTTQFSPSPTQNNNNNHHHSSTARSPNSRVKIRHSSNNNSTNQRDGSDVGVFGALQISGFATREARRLEGGQK